MNQCPHCQTAKRYLDEQKIPYRLCNVQSPKGRKEFASLGMRGVPVLKIGDQVLNGFSIKEFKKLFKGK
jgi:glutaredoxin